MENKPLSTDVFTNIQERLTVIEGKLNALSSNNDSSAIKERLKSIETKLDAKKTEWDKWIVPIIVALLGVVTVVVQIKEQNKTAAQILRFEEERQTGVQIAQEKAEFFKAAKSLLTDIDTRFEDVCNNPDDVKTIPKDKSLAASLSDFYKLCTAAAPDDLDPKTIETLRKYQNHVSNAQFDILGKQLELALRISRYQNSKVLLEEARAALKQSRIKPTLE